MTTEWEKLYAAALAVAVPKVISEQMCSGGVGAAVLTDKGNVYTGVCIDTDCSLGNVRGAKRAVDDDILRGVCRKKSRCSNKNGRDFAPVRSLP
jgi:hypothetical protein